MEKIKKRRKSSTKKGINAKSGYEEDQLRHLVDSVWGPGVKIRHLELKRK
jgi:hypothetical protein